MAAAAFILVVAACGVAPTPESSEADQPIVVEGRDNGFAMSMRVGKDVVDAGAPIDLSATLTWEGAEPKAVLWGSGVGPVGFGLEQLGGNFSVGPPMTGDCVPYEYARLAPVVTPFRKSGGFSVDDPNVAFYKTFLADPVLRLPSGSWRVTAFATGFLEVCDGTGTHVQIRLEATILVR